MFPWPFFKSVAKWLFVTVNDALAKAWKGINIREHNRNTLPSKRVPTANGKTKPLSHRLAHDHLVWIVVTKDERIVDGRMRVVLDLLHAREILTIPTLTHFLYLYRWMGISLFFFLLTNKQKNISIVLNKKKLFFSK